jgi:hypothetical protein
MPNSTITLQSVVDNVIVHGDVKQVLTAGGFNNNLVCSIANDVMQAIVDTTTPWKWNSYNLPLFYSNSWQQDYALIWGSSDPAVKQGLYDAGDSIENLSWLTDGIAVQINNSSTPKPWSWVEVGRRQGRSTATILSNSFFAFPQFTCSFLENQELYYGTWGAAETGNATWGNNPQANQTITSPTASGINSQPSNPITQIQDANGNYLVVTTYGTTGSSAPSAPANSDPGVTVTDGSVVWTVLDPTSYGIRVKPIPSETGAVWQFNLVAQMKSVRFSPNISLRSQLLSPLPDDLEPIFRQGFYAQCLSYSPEAKIRARFDPAWNKWTSTVQSLSLQAAKQRNDRERDEDRFIPEASVMGAGSPRVGWIGSAWPYGYPIT